MYRRFIKRLAVVLLLLPVSALAQHSHQAALQKVQADGFYSVQIRPALSALLQPSLADLRITDQDHRPVPYVVKRGSRSTVPVSRPYPILSNTKKDSGRTELVIRTEMEKINAVKLVVRNAAVSRMASLSGSDDQQKWFTIMENILMVPASSDEHDRFALVLSFPLSSYRYLRLSIENGNNDPLNIVEAGSPPEAAGKERNSYLPNPPVRLRQRDSSDRYSYITIVQENPYHVNRIRLIVDGPKFFSRDVSVLTRGSTAGFRLQSGNEPDLFMPTFNDSIFILKIYNGDNPPLQVRSVETAQEEKRAVAFMKANEQYHLLLHDPSAAAPAYELTQFLDSIPEQPETVQVASIGKIAATIQQHSDGSRLYLWLAITAVLAILSYFTWTLTREVSKKS